MLKFECGQTRQFTVTYSEAPSTPKFALFTGSGDGTILASVTATASSATDFFVFVTLPNTQNFYGFQWTASYASGPDVVRGIFKTVRTVVGG